MDAYDEDSRAPHGPDEPAEAPSGPPPPGPGSETLSRSRGPGSGEPSGSLPAGPGPEASSAPRSPESGASSSASPGPEAGAPDAPRTGVAALSRRYQVVVALTLAVVAVAACAHLAMVFLSVAPANTVSKAHGKAVDEWVFPEFEQNWKLFAPNPLQQNIDVQVRAQVRTKDDAVSTTGWYDLSAQDGAKIDGNPIPSHTQQNELRRAWDFLVSTHSADNKPVGLRGSLSEQYVRRIVVMRLCREDVIRQEGVILRVQVRSSTTNVAAPHWSDERISTSPVYRVLPWWTVPADEAAGGVR